MLMNLVCAQDHVGVRRLDFLPYHFLLTSVGEGGILRYQVLPSLQACSPPPYALPYKHSFASP